jgi:hypothetical protein
VPARYKKKIQWDSTSVSRAAKQIQRPKVYRSCGVKNYLITTTGTRESSRRRATVTQQRSWIWNSIETRAGSGRGGGGWYGSRWAYPLRCKKDGVELGGGVEGLGCLGGAEGRSRQTCALRTDHVE